MNQTMKKTGSRNTVVRLFSYLQNQHIRLTVVGISIIIYVGLSIWNPMYSAIVIDHLWQSIQAAWESGTAFSITWDNMGRELVQLTVQYFFTWIFYYLQSYLMANVAETLVLHLREEIADKLHRLPLKFFDQNKAGEILSRVTSDLDKITEVMQTGLLKLIVAIGTIIGSLIVMFYYSVFLTCIFLVFMVISVLITKMVSKKSLQCASEQQETIGVLTGIVEEYYNGRNVIKAFNHEDESLVQVDAAAEDAAIANQKVGFLTNCVNPLMRFYEINGGKISIDGISVADMTRSELRRNFGMVLQDTWLFGGTIAENIAYGKPDASREEIIAAAKAAKVDYFIRTMPQGYDTMLDNEASNLSAGQRQLLTIARVFLTNPPILILDEATSSVDTRTEVEIGKAMKKLMRGRTSFVIAHRLSTIRDADTILFMEHGNIIEQGNHNELLQKGGAYAALYYSQFE